MTTNNEGFQWNYEAKIENKNNREDSTKWDLENFEIDRKAKDQPGVFPYPRYDLVAPNSFNGLGYGGEFSGINLNNKTFVYNYYYVNKNVVNEKFIDGLEHDVFFTIVVSTDFVDERNYSHISADLSSRNHPNYLAQGFIKTSNNIIQYSAFITGDRDSYAIINSNLFDLSLGRLILIVPQKDRSLRTKQLTLPLLSKDDLDGYIQSLLMEKDVIMLYQNGNAI
ncbi:hypothetical protein C900_05768 [Fulvivirga imtechensis AK7]|uniref:Uncharacterized protein n=2 Tax=Fulvivirga TaxID=396811 RepID=L8JY84_9BACT|nr:hypothetical protein C900_05768 [Fulvivirga imtechensis AK7]